jgi:hypothetical protein
MNAIAPSLDDRYRLGMEIQVGHCDGFLDDPEAVCSFGLIIELTTGL